MDWDFYTREGVLDMKARLADAVKALAVEKGVRLAPDGIVFFDGSMNLPAHGTPWKITLHSGAEKESVLLSAASLADFKAGRFSNSTVPAQIGMALNNLHGPR